MLIGLIRALRAKGFQRWMAVGLVLLRRKSKADKPLYTTTLKPGQTLEVEVFRGGELK